MTIVVLAGVTGASFLAWLPEGGMTNDATFVITEHSKYLDYVKNIHEVLAESTEVEFGRMLRGNITPAEYVRSSEATSTQIVMQIGEFITSKPPEQWQESYILYGEALRWFNSYVAETEVVASLMEDDTIDDERLNKSLIKIEALEAKYHNYVEKSDKARPPQ